jgi:hypothetical protein
MADHGCREVFYLGVPAARASCGGGPHRDRSACPEVEHCLLGVPVCGRRKCPVAGLVEKLGRELIKALGRTTLSDFQVSINAECEGR